MTQEDRFSAIERRLREWQEEFRDIKRGLDQIDSYLANGNIPAIRNPLRAIRHAVNGMC